MPKDAISTGTGGTGENLPAKKGRKGRQIRALSPEQLQASSRTLAQVLTVASQPRVNSDDELTQRFLDYFQRCVDEGSVPTVEECMISTGYSCDYMQLLRTGTIRGPQWSTPETPKIVNWAVEVIRAYDAKMVTSGESSAYVTYIYRSKNLYGMSDKPEPMTTRSAEDDEVSPEEIAKRYTVESSFVEDEPVQGGK